MAGSHPPVRREAGAARRAIVVGAGPAGLAAALALRAAGYTPVVLEQADVRRPAGTALTLWPNAMAALAELGVDAAVGTVGCPAEGNQIRTAGGRLLDDVPGATMRERFGGVGITLFRSDLTAVLLDRVGPAVVRTGARCVGFTRTADTVVARLADGTEEVGEVLIGADGLRSVVRAQLVDGPDPLRYAGCPVWRGVAEYDLGTAPGLLSMGRGEQFGLFPMRDGRAYWFASLPMPSGRAAGIAAAPLLRERFGHWHAPVRAVLAATPDRHIIATDIFDRHPLRRWSSGRVTLVGDAAHPSTPNLGQGTCQALEDAAVLARWLRRGDAVPEALRGYEADRLPRANRLTRQAALLGRLGRWRSPLACWLRDQMMSRAPTGPRQRQLAEMFAFPAR